MYALNGVFVTLNLKEGSSCQWTKLSAETCDFLITLLIVDQQASRAHVSIQGQMAERGRYCLSKACLIILLCTCCCEEGWEALDLQMPDL